MKILVTGGAGYIGSVTTEQLLDQGHEVVVFDNLERGHRSAVDPRARLIEGDLRDRGSIGSAMTEVEPEAVMHFAAYALVPESMSSPEMYFENNLQGGINLASAMLQADVPNIVFSSTCATYGQPETVPISEKEPQCPTNPYGESKLGFERVLNWYREIYGMRAVYLRYFNACGATERFGEDHAPETHIIPIVLEVALGKREKVMVYGDDYDTPDGSCVRDYIHIVDLAQAHIKAITSDAAGPFNLGNGTGYSVNDILTTARRVTGHPIPSEVAPRRPGDPDLLIANAARARDILGWKPAHPELEDIITSAWNWHVAHPDGYED
ncbi:MAG: UDP-glucose 4-epimerase GalE [Lentisphaerae bacterium]|nr:UDP-glucose 4-epimerase GalE [Lentisphaerota bacterium]